MENGGERRTNRRGQRGAALVEFALIAPVLFGVLLGVLTGGITLYKKNSVSNAVREGARLGATLPNDGNWASSVQARVVNLSSGDLSASQVCVKLVNRSNVTQQSSSGCTLTNVPSVPSDAGANDCIVMVWARTTSTIQAVFFSQSVNLDASAVGYFERGTSTTCSS